MQIAHKPSTTAPVSPARASLVCPSTCPATIRCYSGSSKMIKPVAYGLHVRRPLATAPSAAQRSEGIESGPIFKRMNDSARKSTMKQHLSPQSPVSANAGDAMAVLEIPAAPAKLGQDAPSNLRRPVPPKKLLLIANGYGSMTQAFTCMLQQQGHEVVVYLPIASKSGDIDKPEAGGYYHEMIAAYNEHKPDYIFAPFLTKKIPKTLYDKFPIIVHPGPLHEAGPNSIDRCILDGEARWGVTLMEADDDMDAGDAFASRNFRVPTEDPEMTKSVQYRNLGVPTALECGLDALERLHFREGKQPTNARDNLRPSLTVAERAVDFATMTAGEALRRIKASDSRPGAQATLYGVTCPGKFALFNAWPEETGCMAEAARDALPGQVLGHRDSAILVRCCDGSCIWVGYLMYVAPKEAPGLTCTNAKKIKLPAVDVLREYLPQGATLAAAPAVDKTRPLEFGQLPKTYQNVWLWQDGRTMYVKWAIYNGAMSTVQCQELCYVLQAVGARPDVDQVVLLGGTDSFSNGINLNIIESKKTSQEKAREAWYNICAIDDVVRAIIDMDDKFVVAALQSNAGAGGAMVPLAADQVWLQRNVLLNPHYKSMGLFGSEYWTYFLPKRVGSRLAQDLTEMCKPINADQAKQINMVDQVFDCLKEDFQNEVRAACRQMEADGTVARAIEEKRQRGLEWKVKAEQCRQEELRKMSKCFTSMEFLEACNKFVMKVGKGGYVDVSSPVPYTPRDMIPATPAGPQQQQQQQSKDGQDWPTASELAAAAANN